MSAIVFYCCLTNDIGFAGCDRKLTYRHPIINHSYRISSFDIRLVMVGNSCLWWYLPAIAKRWRF